MPVGTSNLIVQCVFQLGTPLQPFVVVQSPLTGRVAVVRISAELFDFFVSAGIPVCEPTTVPPGTLAGQEILCVFSMFIGAQEPIPFAIVQNPQTGEVTIVQISQAAFDFFRSLGVPVCSVINDM